MIRVKVTYRAAKTIDFAVSGRVLGKPCREKRRDRAGKEKRPRFEAAWPLLDKDHGWTNVDAGMVPGIGLPDSNHSTVQVLPELNSLSRLGGFFAWAVSI